MTIAVDRADAAVTLKTVYTRARATPNMAGEQETVHVNNADGKRTPVPRIKPSEHYRYPGV